MIYGYIRVSTDKQDTENQKLGINDKAKLLGLEIEEWISDDGVSGAKEPDDRLLGKLLKTIKRDDVIIASELSRIGRKLFMVMRILEHCMNVGAKVYTVKDGYELGDNVQSKVLAFAFALAAEIEREMIQLRTKEGLKNKRLQGVLLGNSRSANINAHISREKIDKIKELYDEGLSHSEIGRRVGVHRLTVAYHLTKEKYYKCESVLKGFKVKTKLGEEVEVNWKNAAQYGLNYNTLKKYYNAPDNRFSFLGIESIEEIRYTPKGSPIELSIVQSSHPNIDRDKVLLMVQNVLTIPEIHKELGEAIVSYDEVYDYVAGDTEISMLYREKGHLRVKSKRERY
jgi:DNA invertase Pin-like site-specific DNA recombinase